MKACPTCNRTYSDETLSYCLVDGAVLSAPYDPNQTLQLPETRITDSAVEPPQLSTITAVQPPVYHGRKAAPTQERKGVRPWLVIGLGLITLSLIVVVIVLGLVLSKQQQPAVGQTNPTSSTPAPTVDGKQSPESSPSIEPEQSPSPLVVVEQSPTPTVAQPEWVTHNNISINEGTRITFYPGTTPERCHSDCIRIANCRAATYIRAGAYAANDPPMCYLMSAIKTLNPSTCCISFVKSKD